MARFLSGLLKSLLNDLAVKVTAKWDWRLV